MATTIAERLANVERELNRLRTAVENPGAKEGWLSRLTGSRKDDPVFDEIVRLGKEIRDAEEIDEDD